MGRYITDNMFWDIVEKIDWVQTLQIIITWIKN